MPTERFFRYVMMRSDALLMDQEIAPYLVAQMRSLLHSSGYMSSGTGASNGGVMGRFSQGTVSSHMKNKPTVAASAERARAFTSEQVIVNGSLQQGRVGGGASLNVPGPRGSGGDDSS